MSFIESQRSRGHSQVYQFVVFPSYCCCLYQLKGFILLRISYDFEEAFSEGFTKYQVNEKVTRPVDYNEEVGHIHQVHQRPLELFI